MAQTDGAGRQGYKMPGYEYLTEAAEELPDVLKFVLGKPKSRVALQTTLKEACSSFLSHSDHALTFLVAGKSGEGKSTLINSLVGREVCETGDVSWCTTETTLIGPVDVNGVKVGIWDTPGFLICDRQDDRVLASLRSKSFDLLLFCVSMNDRVEKSDTKNTIAMITRCFGAEIWSRAVVVLTQANDRQEKIERSKKKYKQQSAGYDEVVIQFSKVLCDYIASSMDAKSNPVPSSVIDKVPFLPAGIYVNGDEELRVLHDCPDWLSRFWLGCFAVVMRLHSKP